MQRRDTVVKSVNCMPAILSIWRLKVQDIMDAGLEAKSQLLLLNIQLL